VAAKFAHRRSGAGAVPGRAGLQLGGWRCLAVVGLCAVHVALAQAESPMRCGAQGVVLQVLGSGGPELQDQRASSSYLIWSGGRPTVLVDVGGGAALRFGQSGASVAPLEAILLTHLHADHAADLPALVKSSYFESRTEPLPLYGPAGNDDFPATTRFVKALFSSPGGAYRYLADMVTPGATGAYLLQAHDVRPRGGEVRRIHDARGLRIYAASVVHGGVPAIAYRVEIAGRKIAFSGDTNGDNGNLEHLARDVDVLVAHNAVREAATGAERALHMPASVIGRIARDAGAHRLILSHRMLRTLGHEDETETNIRKSFAGPVIFANDLDCFAIL
jgi:ribonuclease BN (tRNA processing enzyme)